MGNLVVVAIPAQDERVWKVSSEKVPHLTLLFLGDADSNPNTERITEFVDHAVTVCEHGPFMLDVDYRGVLGPDEADVLFFKKGWSAKWIEQFRNSLLQNTDIRAAYESTDQFPEWQPHLTLGYPATPANTDDSEHGIRWVSFDRIAVWTGDYAGAEFRLEWPEMDYGGALAYSQETRLGMQFLEHHGVKGMKWGTRKETTAKGGHIQISEKTNMARLSKPNHTALIGTALLMPPLVPALFLSPRFRAEVKAARDHNQKAVADKQWNKQIGSAKKAVEVHNKAATEINQKLPGFNSDKRWKNADGTDIHLPSHPSKQKEYDRAVEDEIINPAYARAAIAIHGANSPGGRYKLSIEDSATATLKVTDILKENQTAQHDSFDTTLSVTFKITRDAGGHILGFEAEDPENTLTQTAELGAEFLAHHGIKGMHWGHRKEQVQQRLHAQRVTAEAAKRAQRPAQTVRAYPTIGPSKHKPGNIATKGGEDHPPTKDAIKVAEARQKIKKSGLHALTNDELRDVATRLNLEQQVVTLEGKRGKQKSLGRKFIEGVLNDKGTQKKASEFVFNQVSKKTG